MPNNSNNKQRCYIVALMSNQDHCSVKHCSGTLAAYVLNWLQGTKSTTLPTRSRDQTLLSRSLPPPSQAASCTSQELSFTLVATSNYRDCNLLNNNLHITYDRGVIPKSTTNPTSTLGLGGKPSKRSIAEVRNNFQLDRLFHGCNKRGVQDFFECHIMPDLSSNRRVIKETDLLYNEWVPNHPNNNGYHIGQPKPDAIYGYSRPIAFQLRHRITLLGQKNGLRATPNGPILPFLVTQFAGQGPGNNDNFWVTENRCIGAASTCVNIVNHLNESIRAGIVQPVDHAIYSIAMSNQHANLFVTWQAATLEYRTALVKGFLLTEPEDVINLKRHVQKIVDWGANQRLESIHSCIDVLCDKQRF